MKMELGHGTRDVDQFSERVAKDRLLLVIETINITSIKGGLLLLIKTVGVNLMKLRMFHPQLKEETVGKFIKFILIFHYHHHLPHLNCLVTPVRWKCLQFDIIYEREGRRGTSLSNTFEGKCVKKT